MGDLPSYRQAAGNAEPLGSPDERDSDEAESPYITRAYWRQERPRILVVACSDGRYQEALDEFLGNRLGILDYDRLYAPGGPGALVPSVISYFRGIHFQEEAKFLMDAHRLERVILIVHGPEPSGGPKEAMCADYLRKMPGSSFKEVKSKQTEDLNTVTALIRRGNPAVEIQVFIAEVRADRTVQFVPIPAN